MSKWKEMTMAFATKFRLETREHIWYCETCGKECDELEAHSMSKLHIVRKKEKGQTKYYVTSTPDNHKTLEGKQISESMALHFMRTDGRDSDLVWVCKTCHKRIHGSALLEAKYRDKNFQGQDVTPQLMLEMTLYYRERFRPLEYEVKHPPSHGKKVAQHHVKGNKFNL